MSASGELKRTLGVSDAVVIGAGSMIGAGVFAAWGPAAGAAGSGVIVGLAIAGVIALCNATSSAALAAVHPESGGTYVYGRHRLGPAWGHLAGWGFVVGKTASCVAMALTVGAYLWPAHPKVAAIAAVVGIAAVNVGGLSRTVAVTRVLLTVSTLTLAAIVVSAWNGPAELSRVTPIDGNVYDWLQAAGFMFFAFAGYARIATLGEEVRDPAVTIPRAIPLALGGVLVVYAIVGVTALSSVTAAQLATADAPLLAVAETGTLGWAEPLTRVGAAIAALGVLLNLIPGVSRTTLAMARHRELPSWLAPVDVQRNLPLRAELVVTIVVVGLIAVLDLRSSIAVSGVAVLTYYAVTNAAALRLAPHEQRFPRSMAWLGLVGCVVLVVSLPTSAVVGGTVVLGVGVIARQISAHRARPNPR
jgi:basic amino acid/polyamine antiporter, APA family